MKEGLKLILEAMIYRVQDEKSYEPKSIDSFCSYNKAKEIAKVRMIKTLEELNMKLQLTNITKHTQLNLKMKTSSQRICLSTCIIYY